MLLLLVACAKLPPTEHGPAYADIRGGLAREGVAVLHTVVVADLPAPPMPPPHAPTAIEQGLRVGEEHLAPPTLLDPSVNPVHAAFLRNEYVGAVRFGGGLIREGETALQTRARLIEFSRADEMRSQGVAWLDDLVDDTVSDLGAPVLSADGLVAPNVDRRNLRGADALDGRDNLNLPRTLLVPTSIAAAADGARWALVPYLRSYYNHNGGWFLGQEWGCSGGARVEVMLVLYDRRTGHASWWQNATGRFVQEMKAQPSLAELDQFLLEAEAQVEEKVARGFLR